MDIKTLGGNFIDLRVAGAPEVLRTMDEITGRVRELQEQLDDLSRQLAEVNLVSAWSNPLESQTIANARSSCE